MEALSTVQFYTRYDTLATKRETLNATRIDLSDKEIRIRELELSQETTRLFADEVGSQLNILI